MTQSASMRDRILDAAVNVFSERGYHGTSVDDIVKGANSSKGSFYFHFPNKEGLFLALVENFAQKLVQAIYDAVEHQEGAVARVEAALRAGIRAFVDHPELAKIFLIEAVGLNPEFEQKRREIYAVFAKVIAGYLDGAVDDGDIAPLDSELAAYATLGSISEVVVHRLHRGEIEQLQQAIPELARFMLGGIGWRRE